MVSVRISKQQNLCSKEIQTEKCMGLFPKRGSKKLPWSTEAALQGQLITSKSGRTWLTGAALPTSLLKEATLTDTIMWLKATLVVQKKLTIRKACHAHLDNKLPVCPWLLCEGSVSFGFSFSFLFKKSSVALLGCGRWTRRISQTLGPQYLRNLTIT